MCQKSTNIINMDLHPAADVANNVINKFSQAVGWVFTPRGSKKDTEIAVQGYIEYLQKETDLDPLVKAAKISKARKDVKEYINLLEITEHAQTFGRMNVEDVEEPLDEDWAMYFYDKAKNISRDDAKVLWGKILAEECAHKDSIPKKLIHTIAIMSREDADIFNIVCDFSVDRIIDSDSKKILIIDFNDMTGLVKRKGVNSEKIFNLQALGLISIFQNGISISVENGKDVLPLVYHGKKGELTA